MSEEIQKSDSNLQLAKNELQALSFMKAKDYNYQDLRYVIKSAVLKTFYATGKPIDPKEATFIVDELRSEILRSWPGMTVGEISLAIHRGAVGEVRPVSGIYKLCLADFVQFIKSYMESESRRNAVKEFNKQLSVPTENQKPSDAEIEALRRTNALTAFETFKSGKPFTDFGNAIYNYLDSKSHVPFTTQRKIEFKNKAIESLHAQLNPIQFVGNQIKMMEAKTLLAEIKADDKHARIIAEAKKIALNQFFNDLAEVETELTDLI